MQHITARSLPGTLLFHNHTEARALWDRLTGLGPYAMVLMPDHVHLLRSSFHRQRWSRILSGYARWRARHRGEASGPVWIPSPDPVPVQDHLHLQRAVRYVLLNPCRAGLVRDPLAWPWSTHRDAVGLAIPQIIPPNDDPFRFHAYVSGDPSVNVAGTSLPFHPSISRSPSLPLIEAAVSAVTRTPMSALRGPGTKHLLIHAMKALSGQSARAIARALCVSVQIVLRADTDASAEILVLERALSDPRFPSLADGDLRRSPAWVRYLARKPRRGEPPR